MKIKTGYKLFERDTRSGNLYPLFIDKTTVYPYGQWVQAENISQHKGFAHRPGLHVGTIPAAPWLMNAQGEYGSQRGKNFERVWCVVEYDATIDYTGYAQTQPKKQLNAVPSHGYYRFRESAGRDWIITGAIRIISILQEQRRQEMLSQMGYDEKEQFEPYRLAMAKRMTK